jgi:hypothetical protein
MFITQLAFRLKVHETEARKFDKLKTKYNYWGRSVTVAGWPGVGIDVLDAETVRSNLVYGMDICL